MFNPETQIAKAKLKMGMDKLTKQQKHVLSLVKAAETDLKMAKKFLKKKGLLKEYEQFLLNELAALKKGGEQV